MFYFKEASFIESACRKNGSNLALLEVSAEVC